SQLKPRALASAARLLAGEDHPQAKAAVADFILAHRERRPRPVRRTAEAELPLYAAPPEPAAPDGGQEGLLKRAAKPAGLAEILESGALVRGGYFAGQTFGGGKTSGAVLDDLVLCRSELTRTRFEKSSFSHLDAGRLAMDQAVFRNCEFQGVWLCRARISRCRFQGCAFTGCDFSAADLEDCEFKGCSFTACQFDYAELRGVRLVASRVEACVFHQAGLADVDGRGVRLDLALFSQARIENMRIQGLDMVECLVEDTRLSGLALEGVDTEGCVFHESELLASDVFAPEFLAMEEAALEQALFDAAHNLQPPPESWRQWDSRALTLAARVVDFWIMHRNASHHARVSLQNNQRRLNWARAKMHPDAAALLTLLPSLLMADLSGHDPGVPCQGAAIVGHTPGFGHQEMLSRLLDKARIAEPSDSDLSAEGLYSIGSTGSIAQTEASDIDLWLVLSPDQDPERVEALRRKLAWIENWAEMSLGLEVHFFVMGLDETRANDFGISDEEGAGSAQALLLKEEFYRTVLCLAGRIPAWWITPPGAGEKAYQRHIRTLGATIDFLGRRVVDLGRLGEIPPGEFFGASLWQIVKALKSPFKSVLKLGLLEKYMDRDKQAGALLCERLKANLLADMHGLWEIDPYALLFKEVNDHYQSRERLEALRLLRTAFLLKTGMGRSGPAPTTAGPGVGAGLSEFFFPPHPFSLMARGETADGLESFAARENAGHQVATFMAKAYDRIRKRLGEIQDVSITQQDLTKLGRRISSFFSQRENKITRIPFMNPPKDAFQSLEFTGEVAGGQVRAWIVKGVAPTSTGKAGKPEKLRRETEPVRLLGWLVANGIFDPSQYLTIDPNLSPVSSTDMERLLADLHAFFPAKKTFFTDLDQNLKPECVVSAYAAVNLLCARNHETLREAALLYSTNWGELFCLPRTISPEKIATRPLDYLRENIDAPLSAAARIGVFTPPKSKCPKVRLTSIAP
ncbi:MAG: class I adenylate cyclase, partial [Desulfovibrionaceae bacterium]